MIELEKNNLKNNEIKVKKIWLIASVRVRQNPVVLRFQRKHEKRMARSGFKPGPAAPRIFVLTLLPRNKFYNLQFIHSVGTVFFRTEKITFLLNE